MTEVEYETYLLYLENVEIMKNTGKGISHTITIDQYLAEPENSKEIKAGLEDIKAGRIIYVDPKKLWESIK